MIIPCINCTSFGEPGGSVALVDGGKVRVGLPGAPGCTTTAGCCADAYVVDSVVTTIPLHKTASITVRSLCLLSEREDFILRRIFKN